MSLQPDSNKKSRSQGRAKTTRGRGRRARPLQAPQEDYAFQAFGAGIFKLPKSRNAEIIERPIAPTREHVKELSAIYGVTYFSDGYVRCTRCGSKTQYATEMTRICLECCVKDKDFDQEAADSAIELNDDFDKPQDEIDADIQCIRLGAKMISSVNQSFVVQGSDESNPAEEKAIRCAMERLGILKLPDEDYPYYDE